MTLTSKVVRHSSTVDSATRPGKDTPALCYGATTGRTPWRFNLHPSDTGHTAIMGATGTGKSVALGVIAANFRAIPHGQYSLWTKVIPPSS